MSIEFPLNCHRMTKFCVGTVISFLFTFNILFAQTINDDVNFFDYTYDQKMVQSHKIESITIQISVHHRNEGFQKYYFDNKGHLVKQEILDTLMKLQSAFLFYTNKHNHLVMRKQMDQSLNIKDSIHFFKKYDGNKLIMDSSGQVPTCSYFKYDQNNNLVACSTYVGSINRTLKVVNYVPDSMGRPVKITEFVYNYGDTKGQLVSDKDIVYNSSGNKEKEVEKCETENLIPLNKGNIEYLYNPKGQLIKKQTKFSTENFKYNTNGLISEKLMYIKMDENIIEFSDQYQYQYRK